jgi:SIR2-like domain
LNYPSWKELLEIFKNKLEEEYIKQAYQAYIDRGDYLGAFDYLKNNTVFNTEKRIKQEIVKIFKEANPKNPFEEPNNYIDLYELNNNFILTTNYDNIFTELATKFGTFALPLILSEIQDHHNLNREKKQRVIHLHGNIDKPDTMIVTKTDYENLYNNPETTEKLMSIMSSKSLLFLGFSFKDEFFVNLYTTITQKVGGQHFIIAPDIDMKKAKEFAEIGLIAISLNVKKDNNGNYCSKDYVEAIKTVLNSIKVN